MIVKFRPMHAGDRELFRTFIRSLPRKDSYHLLADVHNDQAIDRWMEKIQSAQTIGVVALEGGRMISYCNLTANDLPWARHVGEIRISVSAAYRGRGIGKALAEQIFSITRARGLQKLWARRSNDPKVRAAAMDKLNKAHHQAYGDTPTHTTMRPADDLSE